MRLPDGRTCCPSVSSSVSAVHVCFITSQLMQSLTNARQVIYKFARSFSDPIESCSFHFFFGTVSISCEHRCGRSFVQSR
jgi:hypothetical protein